jgi:hypothetical protein
MFPSFEDFLKTLTEEEKQAIFSEVSEALKRTQRETSDKELILGNSIAAISYSCSLSLIERYHHWLSQELKP